MGKIVIINHYGSTPEMPGTTKHYDMAKHFANKKEEKIEFWLCGYNHHTGKNHESFKKIQLQSKITKDGFTTVRIKSSPYRNSNFLRQLNIIIFDLLTAIKLLLSKDIDAVILSVPPVTFLNIWITKIKKIKLIVDLEDLWPLFLVEMGLNNKLAIKYINYCADFTYKTADGIAAVSQGMLDYVNENNGVNKKDTWLAPLGVNVNEYFTKEKDNSLIKNKNWKNDFKIMYLGAHGRANDLISVLDTIYYYNNRFSSKINNKNISFIFIGDGEQKENIVKYAERLQLNNVFFEDAVPGTMVADYLIHADICLTNLMKIESFKLVRPNKLFQYMALGKPIITGIWGEFTNIVEEVNAGIYVDFTEPEHSAKIINDLLNNKERQIEMSKRGKQYIYEEGNREKIFEKIWFRIKKIINKGS